VFDLNNLVLLQICRVRKKANAAPIQQHKNDATDDLFLIIDYEIAPPYNRGMEQF
jgi:hypothetical protein